MITVPAGMRVLVASKPVGFSHAAPTALLLWYARHSGTIYFPEWFFVFAQSEPTG